MDASNEHHGGCNRQSNVGSEDLSMKDELLQQQQNATESAEPRGQHSEHAKEMQGLGRVVQQELRAQEIEKNPERPRDSVVRFAILARRIRDRNLHDASPGPGGEGGDEAVELAVQWDALDGLLAVSLKCSTKIVQRDSGDLCHCPVGNAARQAPRQPGIVSLLTPTAHDIEPL